MNTRIERLALLLALVVAACASNNLDVQPGDADRAVAASDQRFMSAVRAGNVDQLMDFYSESAVLMPPNAPSITGHAPVRDFWLGFLTANNVDLRLVTDDVTQSGDLAVERGHYEFSMTPKAGGATMHDVGKFLVVRRKLNGQWKAVTDMFSSDVAR